MCLRANFKMQLACGLNKKETDPHKNNIIKTNCVPQPSTYTRKDKSERKKLFTHFFVECV